MKNLSKLSEKTGHTHSYEQLKSMISRLGADAQDEQINIIAPHISKLPMAERKRIIKRLCRKTGREPITIKRIVKKHISLLGKKPSQHDIALEIIRKIGKEKLTSDEAFLYQWSQSRGLWVIYNTKQLEAFVQKWIQKLRTREGKKIPVTKAGVKNIAELLKNEVYRRENAFLANDKRINFQNGEVMVTPIGIFLRGHKRESNFLSQIPYRYDQNAKAPRFEQFLDEIFDGDSDRDDKKALLLEMMGYTLMAHSKYETLIILKGHGANGKSVILKLLEKILGKDNISAVKPEDLSKSFSRAYLHGKLANIVTEIPEGSKIPDAEIKSITSGDTITAEQKYAHPFSFSPYCTLWLATNHMPFSGIKIYLNFAAIRFTGFAKKKETKEISRSSRGKFSADTNTKQLLSKNNTQDDTQLWDRLAKLAHTAGYLNSKPPPS